MYTVIMITFLYWTETYSEARCRLPLAEQVSDLNSEAENTPRTAKALPPPRRKLQSKAVLNPCESSDEEVSAPSHKLGLVTLPSVPPEALTSSIAGRSCSSPIPSTSNSVSQPYRTSSEEVLGDTSDKNNESNAQREINRAGNLLFLIKTVKFKESG